MTEAHGQQGPGRRQRDVGERLWHSTPACLMVLSMRYPCRYTAWTRPGLVSKPPGAPARCPRSWCAPGPGCRAGAPPRSRTGCLEGEAGGEGRELGWDIGLEAAIRAHSNHAEHQLAGCHAESSSQGPAEVVWKRCPPLRSSWNWLLLGTSTRPTGPAAEKTAGNRHGAMSRCAHATLRKPGAELLGQNRPTPPSHINPNRSSIADASLSATPPTCP